MNPFSICLIAKNEEKRIERCLSAASKLDAEIVLVDTGSTDRTKELASKYTDKIYDFEWCNDFSAARNFSISKASNDWILVLDCDEYVESFDISTLLSFMTSTQQHNVGLLLRRNEMEDGRTCMDDWVERLFHKKHVYYDGIIHEQVKSKDHSALTCYRLPLTVYHDGYVGKKEDIQQKTQRNRSLLLAALEKEPNNPYLFYQLGQAEYLAGNMNEACAYYSKGLEFDVDPSLTYVQLMVINYGETLLATGRYQDALMLEGIYNEFATTADFVCLMGLIYIKNNKPLNAILEFMKALTIKEHFREDTNNTFPRYHIGLIYEAMGNTKDAIAFFKSCGDHPKAKAKLKLYESQIKND